MRALMLVALTGCAGSHAKPAAPVFPAKMRAFAFYVGDWTCQATEFEHDAPTKHYPLGVEVRPRLDGAWLSIVVTMDGKPITDELKGWDADGKRYVHWAAAADGSLLLTSPGWDGNKMVFQTEGEHPMKMTFTKVDDAHYHHLAEQDGHPLFEKACTRR